LRQLDTALTHPQSLSLEPRRMHSGHRVRILAGGSDAYPAMLDAIAQARTEVLLETYIWSNDDNGRRFVDAVCIKAQEGLQVRCIIDGAGSWGFSGETIDRMRSAGVRLSVFHPVGPWRRRWGWQVRDHRKLLIVDARVAFTGGMNLGNDYAPEEWGGLGWNDVQAQVEGPAVRELARLFEVSWRYAEPETWTETRRNRHAIAPRDGFVPVHGSTTRAQALAVGQFFGRRVITRHLQHAIDAARDRIWIEAAYFVPDRPLRSRLIRAARRGVDVRVMVPQNSDVPFMNYASRSTWGPLLRNGVQIHEWTPGMLHAKTASIDGVWSMIGSYNLDARSLLYNWEVALEVLDSDVARSLESKFEADELHCERVDPDRFRQRGMFERLRERFFHAFRLWL
jgi:cardiolipin synthase A/B